MLLACGGVSPPAGVAFAVSAALPSWQQRRLPSVVVHTQRGCWRAVGGSSECCRLDGRSGGAVFEQLRRSLEHLVHTAALCSWHQLRPLMQ